MLLAVEGLTVGYGRSGPVLRDVSLEVAEGEVVALLGANGAGKTTLLRAVSGLLRPRAGRLLLDGRDLSGVAPHEVVSRGVAHVPEGRRVFARMTVAENLEMGRYARSAEIGDLLETFPVLAERADQLAGTLSGGEQQQLAMARALGSGPRLLLLDEPTTGLAPTIAARLLELVATLRDRGTTVLLVEQSADAALDVADRGYVLATGRVVLADRADALRRDERLVSAYLGGSGAPLSAGRPPGR